MAVVFLLALMMLWLTVAVPKMARSIQRDHEVETMHRGKQYIRAIRLYYRKFHAYPPTVDALVKTNEIRFLRKKYLDPMTGKDDWKPILYGQNKVPTVMGFFGQPLATGSTLGGIGPTGGNGISGLNGSTPTGGQTGGLFDSGSSSASGSLGAIFNSQQDTSSATPATGATDANGNPISGSGTSGLGSAGPASGQTFGGAGIIGVTPASAKQSILVYKKKTHYNEWEFDYDPAMEMTTMSSGGAGLNGTPASNMSNPIGNSFGSGLNNSPSSNSPFSSGPSTTQPTTPTSPQ